MDKDVEEFYNTVGTNSLDNKEQLAVIDFIAYLTTSERSIRVGNVHPVYDIISAFDRWVQERKSGRRPSLVERND